MKIDTLIEQSYQIFSKYSITSSLDVCKACCITDEEEMILTQTPLKELSQEILQAYIHSARSYSEKEQKEMMYFLPRVLELGVLNKIPAFLPESVFCRLFDMGGTLFIGTKEE